ncbi:MAG: hypothetical protein DWQ31_00990 [Planctomycetota bacterium]|nr:MAG: hypothetical protein DWQ31_00990 [Planctomycetota bacterium]REJ92694.1 MAG: hypothetical protein DWQ35_11675 [Planctomycetota bacterium]REK23731.1 MAG: hypothetical protein DWQ42_14645 [Planctomycetota bacterium]REK47584.1 MAG: hypothetical protein DWQ46_03925 [Planctomycetota bacterium]
MEARITRLAILATALLSLGASYRTENFVVTAPTPQFAQQVGEAAERYRRELAIEWLGEELRTWARPCPITVNASANLGAGGATSFMFQNGEVYGWQMTIQGSQERILDSVLPHEVTHTIFATHFRQPLPRWADEGACTTVEHPSEKLRHQQLLIQFLKTGRGISMSRMFAMREYPPDVLPLYAQGFSVARYLIEHGGKRKFVGFMEDALASSDWRSAIRAHYGHGDLTTLQNRWLDWVRQGSPRLSPLQTPPDTAIAGNAPRNSTPATFAAAPPRQAEATPPSESLAAATDRSQSSGAPVRWQAIPPNTQANTGSDPSRNAAADSSGQSATAAEATATARNEPPRRYQAIRQQPPQRPTQRVLR